MEPNPQSNSKQQQQHKQQQQQQQGQAADSDHASPRPRPRPPKRRPNDHDSHPKAKPKPKPKPTPSMEWPDSALLASINHLACHLFEPSAMRSLDGSALYALGMLIKTHADSFFETPPPPPFPSSTVTNADAATTDQSVQDEIAALRADLDARRPIDLTDTRVVEQLGKVQHKAMTEEEKKKAALQEARAKALATRLANRTAEYAKYGLNPDGTKIGSSEPKNKVQYRSVVDDQPFQTLAANPMWCALCRRMEDPTRTLPSVPKPRLVYSAVVDAFVPLLACPVCTRSLLTRPVHCPYCYRIPSTPASRAACQWAQANPAAAVRSKQKAGPVPEPLKCPSCAHRVRVLDDDDPLFVRDLQLVELPARAVRLDEVPPDDEAAPVDWPSRVAAEHERELEGMEPR